MEAPGGWLRIPGVQQGARTLEEQLLGLEAAIAECRGRSVLDLGCAEGLIGQAFADAGAAEVLGIDGLAAHLEIARRVCPGVRFRLADLNLEPLPEAPMHDLVLALAVLHKLNEPERGTQLVARAARALVVIRLPLGSKGVIAGKHSGVSCDVRKVMRAEGFDLEAARPGPRGELVHYWRRRAA